LFEQFHEGGTIRISAPKNHFEVHPHSGTALLVAGGIGITPLLAMAYELREQGRPFEIHYCLSTQGQGAFVNELNAEFPEQLTLHCSDVAKFIPDQVFTSADVASHLYTCGPEGFMDWVIASAKNAGFAEDRVHYEYFNLEVDTEGDAFEVYCTESDVTVQVASDETIASALLDAGVKVDVSCEQGVCGTCISELLEGEADHRDQFLTDDEKADNDQIALCCSRASGPRLVIEI
jgi:vanillate O-demethylase ferredoxin subunit